MSQVASEFQDVPVRKLGRNLEAADRLVALLSTCTDLQTKALLQEHLRFDINQVFVSFCYIAAYLIICCSLIFYLIVSITMCFVLIGSLYAYLLHIWSDHVGVELQLSIFNFL